MRAGLDAMPPTPAIGRFREDVPAGLDRLTKAVETYWESALAPWWPRIRTLCEGDLLYRSRILAEGGARRLFADLSPRVSWRSTGTLRIENALCERAESLGGRGLLLVPSVFGGERVFSVSAEPWQPTVRYPPRGLGLLWREPDRETGSGLAGVVGHTRAAVLTVLSEPATTTEVAARCRLSREGLAAAPAPARCRTGGPASHRTTGPVRADVRRRVAARGRELSPPTVSGPVRRRRRDRS
ncbi:hypothetical protein GCM10029992_32370 [Glycomyces albus]